MTRDEFAAMLKGREYGSELSREEEKLAESLGLLVVTGASDDLTEFYGAFRDEAGAGDKTTHLITRKGLIPEHNDCECDYCGFKEIKKGASKILARFDHKGYSWFISTELPFAVFDIVEDDTKYCRGIVINVKDIPA